MSQETLPPAVAPAEAPPSNGAAVAGFVLAILVAPVGLILSIIGLVKAGKVGGKGRVLSVLGIVSLALMGGVAAAITVAAKEVAKVTQPGCVTGKAAINDNAGKVGSKDIGTIKEGLEATIKGLNAAVAEATDPELRDVLKANAADHQALLDAINTKTAPPAGLADKSNTDIDKLNAICSLGGAKK